MNLLVIGNGFDIAHGLKTSYKDFLKFVCDFQKVVFENQTGWDDKYDKTYIKFIIEKMNANCEDSNKFINELKELLSNNLWIDHFQKVQIKEGWVDFEREISRIIKMIDAARKNGVVPLANKDTAKFDSDIEVYVWEIVKNASYFGIPKTTYDSLSELKERLLVDLNRITRAFELYLKHYVEDVQICQLCNSKESKQIIKELNIDKVLSFNYTNTYERIYGANNANVQYDYIHGKVKKDSSVKKCNLVIGIDEYLDAPEKDFDNEYIEFKKFFQRIYKKTGSYYKKWFGLIKRNRETFSKAKGEDINIYFYGHSLDITDKDIIAELIRQKDAVTTIFYHSREALRDQISNLVKVLSEDELIARTGEYEPSIIFKPINQEDEFEKANGIT